MSRTDAQILAQCQAGDARAFGRLMARHQVRVWQVAYRVTGDVGLSEDLAQEAFITAWARLHELRDPARFGPWVCGIARNLARYARRHQGRHAPEANVASRVSAARAQVAELPSAHPSPLDEVIARQRRELVGEAFGSIPAAYREPMVLFYREHLSIEEISARLELSQATVKQRLCRGRKHLRHSVGASLGAVVLAAITLVTGKARAATVGKATLGKAGQGWISGLGASLWPSKPVWLAVTGSAALASAVVTMPIEAPTRAPGPEPQAEVAGAAELALSAPRPELSAASDEAAALSSTLESGPGQVEPTVTGGDHVSPIRPNLGRKTRGRARPQPPTTRAPSGPAGTVELGSLELERVPSIPAGPSIDLGDVVEIRSSWDELMAPREMPIAPPDLRARILGSGYL